MCRCGYQVYQLFFYFQPAGMGTEAALFSDVWPELYDIGLEARKLKNIFSVNGTALLMDSTVAMPYGNADYDYYTDFQQV